VVKKLGGVLAAVGLVLAAALVKGLFGLGFDMIGPLATAVCFGLVVLVALSAWSNRSSPDPPEPPPAG